MIQRNLMEIQREVTGYWKDIVLYQIQQILANIIMKTQVNISLDITNLGF